MTTNSKFTAELFSPPPVARIRRRIQIELCSTIVIKTNSEDIVTRRIASVIPTIGIHFLQGYRSSTTAVTKRIKSSGIN
ncbi:hypothetical protein O9993_00750 [Vibrio lentus]|nr:hypothetical protein [Vibrio lentus]